MVAAFDGALVAKCKVRLAVGDALSLLTSFSPHSKLVRTAGRPSPGGDGENRVKPKAAARLSRTWTESARSGLPLCARSNDDDLFPLRIFRGVGPRGLATGDGLPPRRSGLGIGDSKYTKSPSPPRELLRRDLGCDPGDLRPARGECGWCP